MNLIYISESQTRVSGASSYGIRDILRIFMSLAKLKKSIKRPIPAPSTKRLYRPAVLGDSISGRLRQQTSHQTHREIYWWCQGGRSAADAVNWVKQNLETEVQLINDKLWLYIQIGTCDFTSLDRSTRYISLKYLQNTEVVEYLINKYKEIIKILTDLSPESKSTVLEIPFFSIVSWNRSHKHKDPETFTDQDIQLEQQILEVNKAIRILNQENQSFSPDFNIDLYRTSNRQQKTYEGESSSSRHGKTKSRRLYNISLLQDGIHPSIHVAKAWLMKLTIQICRDCWDKHKNTEPDVNNNN